MKLFIVTILGAIVIFLVWAGSGYLVYKNYPEPNHHGTFGDMFGAVNALFSGWAFLGVIIAIILQKQELEQQRLEIHDSKIAQQESAMALRETLDVSRFTAKIEALNRILEIYDRKIEEAVQTGSYLEVEKRQELENERRNIANKLNNIIHDYLVMDE